MAAETLRETNDKKYFSIFLRNTEENILPKRLFGGNCNEMCGVVALWRAREGQEDC